MRLLGIILSLLFAVGLNAQTALKLVQTIPLPGVNGRIDHFAMDAQSHRLFMAALGNDTVEVIDVDGGKRLETIKDCSEPQGLVCVPKLNRLFVANGSSGELKIYDSEKLQLLKTAGSLPDADNVRYDASSQLVYVGYGSGALAAFDTNGVQVSNIQLGGHPESFQLEQNGKRIFVNLPGEHSVIVLDREQKKVVAKWRLESAHSNFPMALDESSHRLFVGCRSPAQLVVMDTTNGKTVAQFEIAGDTDDVFYDVKRNRLYVSCGEGFLDVLQRSAGDNYERVAHELTRGGARTCFFSSDLDQLHLAVPKRPGHDAEVRIYQPSDTKP